MKRKLKKKKKTHRISLKISTQLLAVNAAEGQDETSRWDNADSSVLPITEGQELNLPCTVCSSTSCHRDTPAPTKTGRPWETHCICSSSSICNCLKKMANEQNKQMCQVTVCTARDATGLPPFAATLGACYTQGGALCAVWSEAALVTSR